MRRLLLLAVLCCVAAVLVSACAAGQKPLDSGSPILSPPAPVSEPAVAQDPTQDGVAATGQVPPQAPTPDGNQNKHRDMVPEAEVLQLLDAAHQRSYTMTWEISGDPDPYARDNAVLYRTWGRTGVKTNGDRYVLLGSDGFLHVGNQAWYLHMEGGRILNDPPETGRLHQRPGIQSWEALKPDELGVFDGLLRNSLSFEREKTGDSTQQWVSLVPAQKSSLVLFGQYREIVDFSVTVRRINQEWLPVRFHVTWWDAKLISFDGMYDWNPPTFPQVSGGTQ